jgi:hypothetical protein
MHELAHHIQRTEYKQKSSRSHTQLFYAILDDLVDMAEKKKLYNTGIDDDTQKLIDEVRDISCKIAELQRKLGGVLSQLHQVCQEKGVRYEDVLKRKAQISLQSSRRAQKAYALNLSRDIGYDIQEAAIRERDAEKRGAIIHAAEEGKSIYQAKRLTTKPPVVDETESLILEKKRLERTIASLNHRLKEVEEHLRAKQQLWGREGKNQEI